jgi:hypothetical protein
MKDTKTNDEFFFLILHAGLKAALCHVLVDLGADHCITCAYHIHRGFLATFQWSQHFVDHAIIEQRLQTLWGFHRINVSVRGFQCSGRKPNRRHGLNGVMPLAT